MEPPAGEEPKKDPSPPSNDMGTYAEQFQHQPVAARVSERLGRPVSTTGMLVLDSPNEFVLDFLQGLTRPHQIVARVIVVPAIMEQIVTASSDNLEKYIGAFGAPPSLPKPPQKRPTIAEIYETFKLSDDMLSGAYANSVMVGHSASENLEKYVQAHGAPPTLPKPPQRRPTIQEIYETFKLPDELLSGAYANSVMVGHSPAEFFFDFITGFYPTAAVSARVTTSAHHMPRIVDTLKTALQQYRNRYSPPEK